MPRYIVKTVRDRNLVIEADRYSFDATERTYEFFSKDGEGSRAAKKVASVFLTPELLAIIEDKAGKADFYNRYDVSKDDTKTDDAQALPVLGVPSEKDPIEHWRDAEGHDWYGFWTPFGFAHFFTKAGAESGLTRAAAPKSKWQYLDLTGATRLED
jgi:hypothetical protein